MTTLRVQVKVRDYDMWREAFERDAGGRQQSGMRSYRIFRPVDDANCVMLDGEFDTREAAEGFLTVMREKVWPDPEKAPAKIDAPETRIIELVESKQY